MSQVPSESGVYAIVDADDCLLVGEAWNLKARLLELMNILQDIGTFSAIYELCPEEARIEKKQKIAAALLREKPKVELNGRDLPGISFWQSEVR